MRLCFKAIKSLAKFIEYELLFSLLKWKMTLEPFHWRWWRCSSVLLRCLLWLPHSWIMVIPSFWDCLLYLRSQRFLTLQTDHCRRVFTSLVSVNCTLATIISPALCMFPRLIFCVVPQLLHFWLLNLVEEFVVLSSGFGFFCQFYQLEMVSL